jgi:hypothetical protein
MLGSGGEGEQSPAAGVVAAGIALVVSCVCPLRLYMLCFQQLFVLQSLWQLVVRIIFSNYFIWCRPRPSAAHCVYSGSVAGFGVVLRGNTVLPAASTIPVKCCCWLDAAGAAPQHTARLLVVFLSVHKVILGMVCTQGGIGL